jgi:hypothetical protein
MSFEQKDNDLVLFKNDKKETDKHPDYKGSGMVNGVDVWISAWINTSAKGAKYMSLKTQNKDQVHREGMQQANAAARDGIAQQPQPSHGGKTAADFEDEDIPF